MLLKTFRKHVFWLWDLLKGGKVRKHYYNIMSVLDNGSSHEALLRQERDLSALLHHAVGSTQFYNNKRGFISLNDFTVINKSIVRASFDSFISNKYKQSGLIPAVTSGSTGTPFKVYHDKNKKLRNRADTIIFFQKAGYEIGDRIIYMKIWMKDNMKRPFKFWMENTVPVDVFKLDDMRIKNLLSKMEHDKSIYMIVGYASALELICKYLQRNYRNRVNANVKSILVMSETLNDYTRETLQKYFAAPVYSRYSNIENGIIAQQDGKESGRYTINTASYVVEILKMESDEQAAPGQTGRIVITDLFNYGMPIIRYDTGDIGSFTKDSKKTGEMYLERIEGRRLDMLYDTKKNLVSSYRITAVMMKYTDILQFRLIQENLKEFTMEINADGNFAREEELIRDLKAQLGQDGIFEIKHVKEIPLLSSGKRKAIINNILINDE
jgi:phenylacetate-CoA ligase